MAVGTYDPFDDALSENQEYYQDLEQKINRLEVEVANHQAEFNTLYQAVDVVAAKIESIEHYFKKLTESMEEI